MFNKKSYISTFKNNFSENVMKILLKYLRKTLKGILIKAMEIFRISLALSSFIFKLQLNKFNCDKIVSQFKKLGRIKNTKVSYFDPDP